MAQATIRRLNDKEVTRGGFTLFCGLGSCRRRATCMARRGAMEAAFCEPCAEAFCRVNKVGMPPAAEQNSVSAKRDRNYYLPPLARLYLKDLGDRNGGGE